MQKLAKSKLGSSEKTEIFHFERILKDRLKN